MEGLFGAAIAGGMYNLFAGQPLTIIGSTGPILVFETIMYKMCASFAVTYDLSPAELSLEAAAGSNVTTGERDLDYLGKFQLIFIPI